jgi:hypothetical protein
LERITERESEENENITNEKEQRKEIMKKSLAEVGSIEEQSARGERET